MHAAVPPEPFPPPNSTRLARRLRDGALEKAEPIASSNQGCVYRLAFDDRQLAIKTPRGRGATGLINRAGLQREFRAYQRLQGLQGFPRCLGLIDKRWLVLDFVAATPFRQAHVEPSFFDELLATIRAMHQRGVAHGDLKRKANLLVAETGKPVILDFGTAIIERQGFHPIKTRLFNYMRQTDLNAWVKLKYGGYAGVSVEDSGLLKRSRLERVMVHFRKT
ncbi:MAG: hypothetical protein RQ741_12495 [Wenzhouxiangellaceae bacterium]|nr:hypothetical protein [Wenzhouxiangellaceae bacterium]